MRRLPYVIVETLFYLGLETNTSGISHFLALKVGDGNW